MANGFTKDGGVQEQIDATIDDAIVRARSKLHHQSNMTEYCIECGEQIPLGRRQTLPGVELCIQCQSEKDDNEKALNLFNRRGSKDSQLR